VTRRTSVHANAKTAAATAWIDAALVPCRDEMDLFFSREDADREVAKRLCRGCDQLRECAQAALENDERFGIWASVDVGKERERDALRRYLKDKSA
jgi:hypothetical protein